MEAEVKPVKKELTGLPKGWSWRAMEDVADVIGGATPKTGDPEHYESGNIAWLTPADLSGYTEKYIEEGARFITKKGLESCSTKLLPKGTVLFTSRAPIGYVAIASGEVCTNQGFKSFVLDESQVTSDYVYWWLKGAKSMAEEVASGTTFLELSTAKAKKLPIPVAPLPEQRRIVEAIERQLGRLDAAVSRLQAAKVKLKRYKQAVLKAAVEGRLTEEWREKNAKKLSDPNELLLQELDARQRHWLTLQRASKKDASAKDAELLKKYKAPTKPDLEDAPDIPAGWAWCTWDQITNWVTYGFTRPMPHVAEGIPIVTGKNVIDGRIDASETHLTTPKAYEALSEKDRPQPGDILITKDGTIGRAAVVEDEAPFCINQSVAVAWMRSSKVNREYLLAHIQSPDVQRDIMKKARGVAIKHLSITDFAKMNVPLPSLEEQAEIVRELRHRLDSSDEVESTLDAQLLQATRLRQAVLKRAFEGRLV